MNKLVLYIKTFRLRTIPLSLAGIILGTGLAAANMSINWTVFALACLTTVCLQILSNIANELGDAMSGTDSADRQGPAYVLVSGALNKSDFIKLIITFTILSAISGLILLFMSFSLVITYGGFILLLLGLLAIIAAITYTLGKFPYGYFALGDISVFLFFGILSTLGSYFLQTGELNYWILLPASACSFLSVGVLNINNIRDIETDKKNRITIPILIGACNAKIYQTILVVLAMVFMLVYVVFNGSGVLSYLFLITLPAFIYHVYGLWKYNGKNLDKFLPLLVISTFLLCVILALTI